MLPGTWESWLTWRERHPDTAEVGYFPVLRFAHARALAKIDQLITLPAHFLRNDSMELLLEARKTLAS